MPNNHIPLQFPPKVSKRLKGDTYQPYSNKGKAVAFPPISLN